MNTPQTEAEILEAILHARATKADIRTLPPLIDALWQVNKDLILRFPYTDGAKAITYLQDRLAALKPENPGEPHG